MLVNRLTITTFFRGDCKNHRDLKLGKKHESVDDGSRSRVILKRLNKIVVNSHNGSVCRSIDELSRKIQNILDILSKTR